MLPTQAYTANVCRNRFASPRHSGIKPWSYEVAPHRWKAQNSIHRLPSATYLFKLIPSDTILDCSPTQHARRVLSFRQETHLLLVKRTRLVTHFNPDRQLGPNESSAPSNRVLLVNSFSNRMPIAYQPRYAHRIKPTNAMCHHIQNSNPDTILQTIDRIFRPASQSGGLRKTASLILHTVKNWSDCQSSQQS